MTYRTISVSDATKKKFDSAYFAARSKHTGTSSFDMDKFLMKLLGNMKKNC